MRQGRYEARLFGGDEGGGAFASTLTRRLLSVVFQWVRARHAVHRQALLFRSLLAVRTVLKRLRLVSDVTIGHDKFPHPLRSKRVADANAVRHRFLRFHWAAEPGNITMAIVPQTLASAAAK